ncbi:putative Mch2p [Venturia nashicola]|uniref:Putative Mch2p n=1 Tax=Venturia nashicola TaxID=86259 RepID=A0A4Z1P0R7_9PEZI|nr:putative Mch2p [Venturia nashicola]TLD30160.1 putative Mch2p [Venturia nashicola]
MLKSAGFGSTFGVFREYYFNHPPFQGNQLVTEIGVMNIQGLLQLMSPVLLRVINDRNPRRKPMMIVGLVFVVTSSLGAAYSTTPAQIITTQGFLYGIGSGFLFAPSISFIDEWFLERRGLANGIFFGSNNVAAAALSPLFSYLLRRFGSRVVMIGWAVVSGSCISVALLFVRSREHRPMPAVQGASFAPYRRPLFWLLALSMLLQGLANFLPGVYLTSYATDLGVGHLGAAMLLSILSISGMIGQPLFGILMYVYVFQLALLIRLIHTSDHCGICIPLLLSTLVSAFAVGVLWGFGRAYWMMVMFVILFGSFSFSFIVLRSHFALAIVGSRDSPSDELVVSGVLIAVRGVACVTSGFMGSAVAKLGEDVKISHSYGAGRYKWLIVFIGVAMAAAAIGALGVWHDKRDSPPEEFA